jgi:ABC-type multidrug transport system permease subunit
VSIYTHKEIKNLALASIVAGVGSAILFQILGFIVMGYVDPFFIFALIFSTPIAVIIALFVGGVLHNKMKNSGNKDIR